ncbi:DNA polymerase-1 [Agrobacterium sp. RC10-4-1]|uniref:exonuclease n=1 Tax=Agrobacterium sp. RC10-4-1 TaxID=2587039 RepID=UPI0015FCA185|nr:exonuclease [Agrobacterium sp. RC10-4-1]MBA8799246.1 DNA polymerase-1 [Agrobacterium sp. RC10-4-1]MDP9775940.1 DNA polymerase-1 [Rhizobium sp. SORGH_AS_0755]
MSRTLLIDADVVAYQAAAVCEKATDWGDGYWTWHADENEAKAKVLEAIDRTMAELGGTAIKLCLTDSEGNFRFGVLPSYKGNRKGTKKPLVLKAIKQWLIDEHDAYFRPGLEGDDCMGILATANIIKGEKVIVSIDKDMKTIPGLFVHRLEDGIMEISEAEADYWHLYQTLTGDTTDGYAGCPGVGPKKAEALLGDDPSWATVVKAFEKAGLTEADALQQARVSRILRASDYDFKKKEPILWTPRTPT